MNLRGNGHSVYRAVTGNTAKIFPNEETPGNTAKIFPNEETPMTCSITILLPLHSMLFTLHWWLSILWYCSDPSCILIIT